MSLIPADEIFDWKRRSESGEVCGIFGCHGTPTTPCPHCGNWYCDEHSWVLHTRGHLKREVDAAGAEWLDEPDREEFEHAGLKCLILRNPELGMLCGYVGVSKGHPCYGKDRDDIPYHDLLPIEVHGGVTFSGEGDEDWRPAGYWWLGFDCAHGWDRVPLKSELVSFISEYAPELLELLSSRTYRNFQYVREETKKLADQLATLNFIDWEFKWVWPLLLPRGVAHRIWLSHGRYRVIKMKKKGTGMTMTIILVALCSWVAIVGLVIKPDLQTGVFLSLAGGGVIGLVIAYLIQRWWFRVSKGMNKHEEYRFY